jgi:GntR family transcriptional regulator
MFVNDGAKRQLLKDERQRFLDKEWPAVVATIHRLGLDAESLLKTAMASPDKGDEND